MIYRCVVTMRIARIGLFTILGLTILASAKLLFAQV
jgi:hypothetical protein